jgi:methylenetetrahydrofolate dehydrogenase (NADP+)/methenyltetrahydrofolate cyclohydrolase
MAVIMDGESLARALKKDIATHVSALKKKGITPALATILIGERPASKTYVRLKERDCQEVGIRSKTHELPAQASEQEILELIDTLNKDEEIHGILVQLPLPPSVSGTKVVEQILPEKDVDGLHSFNVGKLWLGTYDFDNDLLPCTPKGIMKLLDHYKIELAGKDAVIINRSNLVGKPLSKLFLDRDATVTMCHSKTKNLKEFTKKADILVTAVGRRSAFIVTEDMVKEGAVVVDVGISYVGEKVCGDIDFEKIEKKATYVTPCPGGVGPMTRVMLLYNVLNAAKGRVK